MDEKSKQIAIGIGTTTLVSIGGILGYWYYKKIKEQAKIKKNMDEMIAEGETEYLDEREMSDLEKTIRNGFDGIENLRMPKLAKSRWKNIDSEYEEIDDYQDDRPILKKLKSAIVNKLYPQDYDRSQKDLEDDLKEFEKLHKRRSKFTVYGSTYAPIKSIQDRFKVMETHGDKGVAVRTGRLRESGNVYRKDTPSGYNKNNRNVNFADLGLGD